MAEIPGDGPQGGSGGGAPVETSGTLSCPLAAGLGAGLLVGLVDAAQAASQGLGTAGSAALLILDLFAGLAWGTAFIVVAQLASWFHRRWRVPTALTLVSVACLASIPLSLELFSGTGVRQTVLGKIGPWALPPLLGLLVAALWTVVVRARTARWGRIGLAVGCVALGGLALAADQWVLVGLYDYLHVAGALGALALLAVALGLTACGPAAAPRRVRIVALAATFTLVTFALVLCWFPSTNHQRLFISEHASVAARVARALTWVVDFDGDGSSPILGGGDCDDFDAAAGPFRAEIEANGRDENCDGQDFVARSQVDLGYPQDADLAARVRQRAQAYPTVILLMDALRADRVGRPEFANLNRLARRSRWFRQAYAPASSTSLSIPAIAVGRPIPRPADASVFERLQRAGVRTGLVTVDAALDAITGKLSTRGNLSYPFGRGFGQIRRLETRYDPQAWGGGIKDYTGAKVTQGALQLLDTPEPPGVLWVHYFDLHQWQHLGALRQSGPARYDETLALLDQELGHWLRRADRLNLILLADHGELLGEHGKQSHTNWLYRQLVRVPLLLSVPGVEPGSIARPVALTDLAATLLDLHGKLATSDPWRRRSLLGVTGSSRVATRPIPMFEVRQVSLLSGRWRYLGDKQTHAQWLFDLQEDPEEATNLAQKYPHRTAAMLGQLMAIYSRLSADGSPP